MRVPTFRRSGGWRFVVLLATVAAAAALASACGSHSPARAEHSTPGADSPTGSGGSGASAPAVTARNRVRLVRIGRFDQPVYLAAAPGDTHRLFVVERPGRIVVVVNGHARSRPFLDIADRVRSGGQEQGLLSVAFAPDYVRSGRLYVSYTLANNDVRVVEYRRATHNSNTANPASARVVITVAHPFTNHNGGQLQFGPDRHLYFGIGDGGSEGDPRNYGQSTAVLDGKILRIDPRPNGGYSILKRNPFVGKPGRRPEIWAYGLRNPWRFSFDRLTGDLVIGDVGQNTEEEVDFAARGTGAGVNYGWSVFEGDRREKPGTARGAVRPVLVTQHRAGNCAIIGGYVVRDRSLRSLYGRYVYGDLCKPEIRSVKLSHGHARGDRATGLSVSDLASFGQDTLGRVYAVSLGGPVYRLAAR
jgi:glucose/arabinose dehydrogenase